MLDFAEILGFKGRPATKATMTPDNGTFPAVMRIEFEGGHFIELIVNGPVFAMNTATRAYVRAPMT